MTQLLRKTLSLFIAFCFMIITPAPVFAAPPQANGNLNPTDIQVTADDFQLAHFGKMREENPILFDFAMGEPVSEKPLWVLENDNPLVDQDPFFMRSQKWDVTGSSTACNTDLCFSKMADGSLVLSFDGQNQTLTINQKFTPLLETDNWIFLSADDLNLFQSKVPGEADPGEGVFFVSKKDLPMALDKRTPLPIFYFPLPGAGWTGKDRLATEIELNDQTVFYTDTGFGLPVDNEDIANIEDLERRNLLLAQTWTFLEKKQEASGMAYPRPGTTMVFGLWLSGQLPNHSSPSALNNLDLSILPKAFAAEEKVTNADKLDDLIRQRAEEPAADPSPALNGPIAETTQDVSGNTFKVRVRVKPGTLKRPLTAEETALASANSEVGVEPLVDVQPADALDQAVNTVVEHVASEVKKNNGRIPITINWRWPWSKKVHSKVIMANASVTKTETVVSEETSPTGETATVTVETVTKADATAEPVKKKGSWWRAIWPLTLYGGTAALAVAAYQTAPIDWEHLITADMPQRVMTVTSVLGMVLGAGTIMKYTIHRKHFDEKYPKTPGQKLGTRVTNEVKGIFDEFAHASWASLAVIPQGIRHSLEYLKDRFIPDNKTLHKAWEATIGFQMKASSRLAVNWKTFLYGAIIFGMADSMMVAVDLLIFTPWLMHQMGLGIGGAAAAAFASTMVLSNFLGYLQTGAHEWSAQVKQTFFLISQDTAKRKLIAEGKNPEAAENENELTRLTQEELNFRYKAQGLPEQKDFLYDPITVLEKIMRVIGYGVEGRRDLTQEQKDVATQNSYVLSRRHWGIVVPALKRAIRKAKMAYELHPTQEGKDVLTALNRALKEGSVVKGFAAGLGNLAFRKEARQDMKTNIETIFGEWLQKNPNASPMRATINSLFATVKGTVKYLAGDSTLHARDMRSTIFLASAGNAKALEEYLPASWFEGISKSAGLLAAEEIHNAFFSILDHRPEMIDPRVGVDASYGERALKVMQRVQQSNPGAFDDPFIKQMRYWELIGRLKKRDDERLAVATYEPPKMSGMAKKQWNLARKRAAEHYLQDNGDETVAEEWMTTAAAYAEKAGKTENFNAEKWAKTYRYRMTVAQELAKQLGTTVLDLEESDYVRKVAIEAAIETESLLSQDKERIYMDKLEPSDKRFYEAQLFAQSFVNNYVTMAVSSMDFLPASSPEYPGRFQGVRRAVSKIPGAGKTISTIVAAAEFPFRNEQSSYQVGKKAWFYRNVPVLGDMWFNFTRDLRFMPTLLTFSYFTSMIWQVNIPYSLWVVLIGTGFIAPTLIEMYMRMLKNLNVKPMEDVVSKLIASFVHSRFTNPEVMAIQAIADPLSTGIDNAVFQPVRGMGALCADLLTGRPGPRP